jgi:hypothetical protein
MIPKRHFILWSTASNRDLTSVSGIGCREAANSLLFRIKYAVTLRLSCRLLDRDFFIFGRQIDFDKKIVRSVFCMNEEM